MQGIVGSTGIVETRGAGIERAVARGNKSLSSSHTTRKMPFSQAHQSQVL